MSGKKRSTWFPVVSGEHDNKTKDLFIA